MTKNVAATSYSISATGTGGTFNSWEPSGGASLPAANIFYDGFESGNMSTPTLNTHGASFEANNFTSIVTMDNGTPTAIYNNGVISNVDSTIPTKDWTAKDGHNSLRFRYHELMDRAEQRLNFTTPIPDLWCRIWLRVPFNFSHPIDGLNVDNHKLLAAWNDTYDGTGSKTWQMRPDGVGGDARVIVQEQLSTPFISVATDLGRWMQLVFRIKQSTGLSSGDGILQLYRRWENESTFTKLQEDLAVNNYESGGVKHMYFMGWVNERYSEETEWLLDTIEISSESLI